MSLNFRTSVKVGKFGQINLSKSAIGTSISMKDVSISKSATGKTSVHASFPKTGISYTKTLSKKK